MPGTLSIVATPIGNLKDVSERMCETFASVSAVLCEDTRVTSKLMAHIGVHPTLIAYHQHSDDRRTGEIIERLRQGEHLALVTDAGTPGISDPGGKLIERVVEVLGDEVIVTPIPGPSAVIAALSISGFPTDRFTFTGFPPHKKGRKTYFAEMGAIEHVVAFYESTHRIHKTLAELGEVIGDRSIMIGRELTKLHETIYRGTCASVERDIEATSDKGEFVIVIGPK